MDFMEIFYGKTIVSICPTQKQEQMLQIEQRITNFQNDFIYFSTFPVEHSSNEKGDIIESQYLRNW